MSVRFIKSFGIMFGTGNTAISLNLTEMVVWNALIF